MLDGERLGGVWTRWYFPFIFSFGCFRFFVVWFSGCRVGYWRWHIWGEFANSLVSCNLCVLMGLSKSSSTKVDYGSHE